MSIDRRLAHATDMLDFVRELRTLVGTLTLEQSCSRQVAHETLYRTVREDLPATESALAAWLQTQTSADD